MKVTPQELKAACQKVVAESTNLIVWPETSFGNVLNRRTWEQDAMVRLVRDSLITDQGRFISGALLCDDGKLYNSALSITKKEFTIYTKQILVPFSESRSFHLLSWMELFGDGFPSISTEKALDKMSGICIGICWEQLFGEQVAKNCVQSNGRIIVFIGNEQWSRGASITMLKISALRAIENRKIVIRAVSDGVSGVISPSGKITSKLPTGNQPALTSQFTVVANDFQTFYMRHGDYIGRASLVAMIILFLIGTGKAGLDILIRNKKV